jgi:hypothetical protein
MFKTESAKFLVGDNGSVDAFVRVGDGDCDFLGVLFPMYKKNVFF